MAVLWSGLLLLTALAYALDWRWGRIDLAPLFGFSLATSIIWELMRARTAKRAEESRKHARETMDANWKRQHERGGSTDDGMP